VVLLVDDDADLRGVLEFALTGMPGVEVHCASSGEDALALAKAKPVDLVLTDFRMGGMTGVELLQALRKNGVWPRLGAVLMSGDDDERLLVQAHAAGARQFWRKPVSATKLRQYVNSLEK